MKKVFAERIKLLRKEKSQVETAIKLGITQSKWQRIESGKCEPNLEMLCKICIEFNVSSDWLLGIESVKNVDVAVPSIPEMPHFAGKIKECPMCSEYRKHIENLSRTIEAQASAIANLSEAIKTKNTTPVSSGPRSPKRDTKPA